MSVLVRSVRPKLSDHRNRLAKEFLIGSGLEIGALNKPVAVPRGEVRYLDRCDDEQLIEIFPEAVERLVAVDCVDDIEVLETIEDASQDFVIACQVLEHCSNVLAAFHTLYRVLKLGGILFLSTIDKRHTQDRYRPTTPLGHLAADFVHGPAGSWTGHLEEWATFIEGQVGGDPEQRLQAAQLHAPRIRQHVWTPQAWLELILAVQTSLDLELLATRLANHEIITVLRKVM